MENIEKKPEVKEVKKDLTPVKKPFEATYTIPELMNAAKTEFNTSSIVVRAALTKAGKEMYTMKEAKLIIEKMKKKEVTA